jgi:putative cell wall-binding protein
LKPDGVVYLMGGQAALSDSVEASFHTAGLHTERIAGANRFETAALAADHINASPTLVLVTSGIVFADAMTATPVAVTLHAPIILVDGDTMPQASLTYLAQHPTAARVVIGGTASVGDGAAAAALTTDRVAGADRFETAVKVATRWFPSSPTLVLATGSSFQDAAIAGAMSGHLAAPTILTSAPSTAATYGYVRDRLRSLRDVRIVGTTAEVTPSTVALLLS